MAGKIPIWPPPHRGLGISTVPHTYLEGTTAEDHDQGLVSLHPLQEEHGWLPKVIYAGQVTSLGEKVLHKPLVPYTGVYGTHRTVYGTQEGDSIHNQT